MTTNLRTDNPLASGTAGTLGAPAGLPSEAVLAQLANEFFAALPGNGGPFLQTVTALPTSPDVAIAYPDEAALYGIPASLAGDANAKVTPVLQGQIPPELCTGFYFLQAVQRYAPDFLPAIEANVPVTDARQSAAVPVVTDFAEPVAAAGSPHYFLDGTHVASRTPLNVAVPAPAHDFGPLPDLGLAPSSGQGLNSTVGGSPVTAGGELAGVAWYFLDEISSGAGAPLPPAPAPQSEPIANQASAHPGFDVINIRRDFPILQEQVHGQPLIWLDNAATTQKPQAVIDRLAYFYQHENSNIHRAAHALAARATDAYEAARDKVARFLHASSSDEIVFVRGTTEGINLIAKSWGKRHIGKDDEIVITWLEHHANIVPWQQLCAETGARLRVAPVDDRGQILLDEYERLLGPRTRLVSISQVSNALGTVTPLQPMIEMAHRYGARVLVDGAQGIPHISVDVTQLDCDWYVFSGHKVFGPTGIGAVYGKLDLLNATPPWQGGGNMIQDVTFERTLYQAASARFEAGTGNIADAVGLGAALDYVERVGHDNISRYEHDLLVYATRGLETIPGLRLIGTAQEKASVLSFVLDGFRSEDVGEALNREGIAVRSGHHCAQPILRRFGLESTVRPSLAFYNTCEEIDYLVATLLRIQGGSYALAR